MMASMQHGFNPALGANLSGQPMVHMSSNQAMPGARTAMGIQHAGMSAPNMGQMPPAGSGLGMRNGNVPGASNMSQLASGQNPMFQQQQQLQSRYSSHAQLNSVNNQLEQQRRQILAQQQQQRAQQQMLAQLQQNGGMLNNPGDFGPGQQAAMRNNPNLPPQLAQAQQQQQQHLQQQQQLVQQQAQMRAAQQQQAAQMQRSAHPQQLSQHQQQQQRQQAQIAQTMAMQQAASQASAAHAQQNLRQAPSQLLPDGLTREQMQQKLQMQHQQSQRSNMQSQPQQPPPMGGPQQPPPPPPSQTPQPGQQLQQRQQAQKQQQLAFTQRQLMLQNMRQQQQGQQHLQAPGQPRPEAPPRPPCTLLLHAFADRLSEASTFNRHKDITYWQELVDTFFADEGIFRQRFRSSQDQQEKLFELFTSMLPRFLTIVHESGVQEIKLHFDHVRERLLPTGNRAVECQKANLIYAFANDHQLHMVGKLFAQYSPENEIEIFNFVTEDHVEYISRSSLIPIKAESPDSPFSPEVKSTATLPKPIVNDFGMPRAVWQFLEISDTMISMSDIFRLAHLRGNNMSAANALRLTCQNPQLAQSLPQPQQFLPPHLQQQQMAAQMASLSAQQGFTPAQAALMGAVPGGIHPGAVQSHNGQPPGGIAMSHQMSHGGPPVPLAGTPSNAAVGSAQASPNMSANAKRRRPSGMAASEEDANAGNGKVKQSPRVAAKKGRSG